MARLEGARLGLAMRIMPAKYFAIRMFPSLGTPVKYSNRWRDQSRPRTIEAGSQSLKRS